MNSLIKRTLLTCALAAACVAWSVPAAAQALSLDEAVRSALERHDKVAQYRARLAQRKDENMAAWGNFLPSVRLEGSYNHLNEPMQIDLDPIRQVMVQLQASNQVEFTNLSGLLQGQAALTPEQRGAVFAQAAAALNGKLPAFKETFKEQNYRTATLLGVQPLFMGGKLIAAKRAAGAEEDAAVAELRKTEAEVEWQTVGQYLAVTLLQQTVALRENVLDGMRRHATDAQKLFEEGMIAKAQLLRAKVAVADAERNLFDDRNRLDLARIALRQTIGAAEDAPLLLSDSLAYRPFADSLESDLSQAAAGQPALQMLEHKRVAASQKFVAERAEFLPRVAGFAKYEMYPEYLSSLEPRWVAGVQLSLPLFEGGKRYYRVRAAQHLNDEVRAMQVDARKSVTLWVQQSYRSTRNAEVRWRQLEPGVELAEESVRQNEKRFQTGLGTSLEVIDSELALEKSRLERLVSLYDYYKSLNDLSLACGQPDKVLSIFQSKEQ